MKKTHIYPLLGAHMSTADGLYKAIQRGESIGCTAIQIFTKSNRQWHAKDISAQEVELFLHAWYASPTVVCVVAHASYLINLGSPKKDIAEQSVHALGIELKRAEILEIPYLVIHPGAYLHTEEQQCLNTIIHNIDRILQKATGTTKIVLEIMAGQGSNVCYTFEQLAYIREKSSYKERIGICFDTCHAWAAGYAFNTAESYENLWKNFDLTIGIQNLNVIHLNDSKHGLKSRKDRHSNIGQGTIGLEAFQYILNDQQLKHIPKILETPKESLEDDARNLEIVRSLMR